MVEVFLLVLSCIIVLGWRYFKMDKHEFPYGFCYQSKADALAEHLGKRIVKIPAHYEVKDAPTKE